VISCSLPLLWQCRAAQSRHNGCSGSWDQVSRADRQYHLFGTIIARGSDSSCSSKPVCYLQQQQQQQAAEISADSRYKAYQW
jgi:hypothetical protein